MSQAVLASGLCPHGVLSLEALENLSYLPGPSIPPVGKSPGSGRGGKAQRRAQQERMLGSGGEFGSGHVESKVVGGVKDSAGSAAGLPGLAVSPFGTCTLGPHPLP